MTTDTAPAPLFSRQLCFVTTEDQFAALDQLKAEFGKSSRADVAREAIDAGLAIVRKRYERSTLIRRKRSPARPAA